MSDRDELLTELRSHNEYLRRQLEVWQEEARRKDHIIAALTERIPELEPARESTTAPRESPETSAEAAGKGCMRPPSRSGALGGEGCSAHEP